MEAHWLDQDGDSVKPGLRIVLHVDLEAFTIDETEKVVDGGSQDARFLHDGHDHIWKVVEDEGALITISTDCVVP